MKKPAIEYILDSLPLIAPIPTAYAIGMAMQSKLNWPDPITWIAAAGIEAAGFVSADTAAKYYEFNRTTEGGEIKAPAWIAYSALGLYVVGTLVMTFMYEPLAAIFPVLSAVAFVEFVLRKDQQARVASRETNRQAAQALAEQERVRVRELRRSAREFKRSAAQASAPAPEIVVPVAQSAAPATKYPHECGLNGCTYVLKNAQSVGGHMKAKHPAALGIFEPITKEQAKP